jgi:hypothetical protein
MICAEMINISGGIDMSSPGCPPTVDDQPSPLRTVHFDNFNKELHFQVQMSIRGGHC